jgi:hypothetical protein
VFEEVPTIHVTPSFEEEYIRLFRDPDECSFAEFAGCVKRPAIVFFLICHSFDVRPNLKFRKLRRRGSVFPLRDRKRLK